MKSQAFWTIIGVLAVIGFIYWLGNRNQGCNISNGTGSGARSYRVGGAVSGGAFGVGVDAPVSPSPIPVNPTVLPNIKFDTQRQLLRCCDWLDLTAYQICLSKGQNCGWLLNNCSQSSAACGANRNIPLTIEQIHIEAGKRGIPDNIKLLVINSLNTR